MKFSIVIPCFDHFELTGQLLMDIYQNCPTVDEVIVVDDASKDGATFEGYKFWKRLLSSLKIIQLEQNVGFLKASNIGLKEASGDIVALISNDVRILKDLPKIVEGIFDTPNKILLGGKLYTETTGWNDFDGRIFPYVEGWALITKKMGWQLLGYFDEQFAPHDFEDVDLSTTALSMGCELKQFPPWYGDVLEHGGAKSIGYNDERLKITEAHRELFREKWITKVSP